MANLLYQTIEQISREKHIEPEIIVAAIEDAMVVAARKYYRTEEELRSKFNPETGQIDVYSVHIVVEEVTDPLREISLADSPAVGAGEPYVEPRSGIRLPQPPGTTDSAPASKILWRTTWPSPSAPATAPAYPPAHYPCRQKNAQETP